MTAAHNSRIEAQKEAAILRSLAEAVVSPVVAGRKSRKSISPRRKTDWLKITDVIASTPPVMRLLDAEDIAANWRNECKFAGIGSGLLGWIIWNWAFPLLLELAKLWVESLRNTDKISER